MSKEIDVKIGWRNVPTCPLCGSEEKHWYTQKFWADLKIPFWICKCGLVYAGMVPADDEEIQKYYDAFYTPLTTNQHGIEKLHKSSHARALRITKQLDYLEVERHLDVGCGHGGQMREMQKRYNCVSEGHDIRNFVDDFKVYSDMSEIEGTYDLVTCIHTLEHVPDPVGFLKKMRPLCSLNLFIEVPSFRPEDGVLSPHHLFGFTTHTLSAVVNAAGFRPTLARQVLHSMFEDEHGRTLGKIELQLFAEVIDE